MTLFIELTSKCKSVSKKLDQSKEIKDIILLIIHESCGDIAAMVTKT